MLSTETILPQPTKTMNTEKPDYQLAAEELAAFYNTLGLSSAIESLGRKKDPDGWEHNAFRITFTGPEGSATFPWNQGIGINEDPKPAEVLACVAGDYWSTHGVLFESWADTFGYDSDSRKAEAIYNACKILGNYLQTLLRLSTQTIETLANFASRL